ncbi:alpha/beta fold hydrolase [Thermosynechococcus sichuanensis E542]|uniref:Alpha/beta fold hydrolase n=1 Tax=Thermosynechococcus sichuanensis E542 TaxID=2016101 RepID=A0A7D6IR51_9CYAN|nr:alpha/beta fold hydrolase [Thermosynechococcus vestitus]QLL29873.1 alpha/beta fold hydrolase [Thermosynechococcus vestitus E542]
MNVASSTSVALAIGVDFFYVGNVWYATALIHLVNSPFFYGHLGSDRACLLLHGLGGGAYELQLLAEVLYEAGWTAQGILYPGHDRPNAQMPASTCSQWYEAVVSAFQALRESYPTVAVIGFSTGGTLALHLAHHYPVDALVLLAPFLRIYRPWFSPVAPERLVQSLGQWMPWLPRRSLPIRDRPLRQAAEAACFFKSFNLQAVRSALDLIAQVELELPMITTPTLILQSRADTTVDPQGAQIIYEQLGSSHKELHWLKDSDHLLPLDVEREQVFAKVVAFLGR